MSSETKMIEVEPTEIEEIKIDRSDVEESVKDYYRDKGYNAIKSPTGLQSERYGALMENLLRKETEYNPEELIDTGVPDLFVWNEEEFFFVEVKNSSSLSKSQKDWFAENREVEIKVVFV